MFTGVADHHDLADEGADDGDVDVAALEEIIIDLRDSVVRPAPTEVAVVHLAQMIAAGREQTADPDSPR
jgi:hypothetical protein